MDPPAAFYAPPMAARVVALLAAVAMVVGAIAVRGRMDDRDERRTTALRVVCASELAAVCDRLAGDRDRRVELTVEAAATTAGRLARLGPGQGLDLDGWLVPAPWPQMVAEERERAGLEGVLATGEVLARSPVVLAVWPDRAAALRPHCGDQDPGWRCLGDVAGRSWDTLGGPATWGPVKPGHAHPSTATGIAVLGAATAAFFGRADLSSADLETDEYRAWLLRLEREQPSRPPSPLEAMVVRGPSAFDAVGTLEAEAGPLLARSARPDKPRLLYPSPVATADVVLATAATRAGTLLSELVAGDDGRRALARSGWRVTGEAPAAGVPGTPALPPTSGLPAAGVLSALRVAAEEAAR